MYLLCLDYIVYRENFQYNKLVTLFLDIGVYKINTWVLYLSVYLDLIGIIIGILKIKITTEVIADNVFSYTCIQVKYVLMVTIETPKCCVKNIKQLLTLHYEYF